MKRLCAGCGAAGMALVARQRTCPIGELIHPNGDTRSLEYKSTMRWDVNKGEKASYIEDAVVKTIAGFANSLCGGMLLVGVTDGGGIYGLEEDYATFSREAKGATATCGANTSRTCWTALASQPPRSLTGSPSPSTARTSAASASMRSTTRLRDQG